MDEKIETLKLQFQEGEIKSFFDCLSDILLKLSGGTLHTFPDFRKHFSKYMACRYLSMKPQLFGFAEYLNKIQGSLTNEQFYKLAYGVIPRQKYGYIKYLAKPKKKEKPDEECDPDGTLKSTASFFDL